jgi:hypothetical protein
MSELHFLHTSTRSFPLSGGRLGWGLTRREGHASTPSLALPMHGGGDIRHGGLFWTATP